MSHLQITFNEIKNKHGNNNIMVVTDNINNYICESSNESESMGDIKCTKSLGQHSNTKRKECQKI